MTKNRCKGTKKIRKLQNNFGKEQKSIKIIHQNILCYSNFAPESFN